MIIQLLSRGMSLKKWAETGLIDRELELLCRLSVSSPLVIMTYNYSIDEEKSYLNCSGTENLEILGPPKVFRNFGKLGAYIYLVIMPFLHFGIFLKCDVIRSNQFSGILPALIAKILMKKKFIARSGFHYLQTQKFEKSFPLYLCLSIWEKIIVNTADSVIVASSDYNFELQKRGIPSVLIQNFVLSAATFTPRKELSVPRNLYLNRILLVGRIVDQKNYPIVFLAASLLRLKLCVVGNGKFLGELKSFAERLDLDVIFYETLPNEKLLASMCEFKKFAQLPLYEGNPKTLLEAMYIMRNILTWRTYGVDQKALYGDNVVILDNPSFATLYRGLMELRDNNEEHTVPELNDSPNSLKSIVGQHSTLIAQLTRESQ